MSMASENDYLKKVLFTNEELNEFINIKIINSVETIVQKADMAEKKAAVFVHLYYEELIPFCINYILSIPEEIDIYISVVTEKMKKQIGDILAGKVNHKIRIVLKENRGRDISSLLVTFRKKIVNYQYVCFIHDKGISGNNTKEDTEIWMKTLWDNLLRDKTYISNLLYLLDENKALGLLVPPIPYGIKLNCAFDDLWGGNYENITELANKLDINYCIKRDSNAYSISTAFWCRTEAFKKIFDKEWVYEDFPDEPMPIDGTLNHAIERILTYTAFGAGYNVSMVMNDEYAARQCENMYKLLGLSFKVLRQISVDNIEQLIGVQRKLSNCLEYAVNKGKVYIYGAGKKGIECYAYLAGNKNIEILGFIVSDGQKAVNTSHLSPIYELSELSNSIINHGLIIALNDINAKSVLPILKENGITDYFLY
ncbi:MAG: rhamnan synthesis F family protein [Lachnospiraceae bacterium]|nr:rhamnan synthesis F family protein [Lachnospiraceae bacterium]